MHLCFSIRRFNAQQINFAGEFSQFLNANSEHESDVTELVRDIIQQIRSAGDEALISFTQKFESFAS